MQSYVNLSKEGFELKVFESFNYSEFVKDPKHYLTSNYSAEIVDYIYRTSSIDAALKGAQEVIDMGIKIHASVEIDLNKLAVYLDEGYTACLNVNCRKLQGRDGMEIHFILVYKIDDTHVYMHDSNININVKVPRNILETAWYDLGKDQHEALLVRNKN